MKRKLIAILVSSIMLVAGFGALPASATPCYAGESCYYIVPNTEYDYENWSGKDLRGVDFSGTFLYRVDLSSANLEGANFTGARLTEVNLNGADLAGANFTYAIINNSLLNSANLDRVNLSESQIANTFMSGASYAGANLTGATLSSIMGSFLNFTNANLNSTLFYYCTLGGINFKGASFDRADLTSSTFSAVSSGNIADTYQTQLPGGWRFDSGWLLGPGLAGSNFRNADLSDMNLVNLDFSGADFRGANLSGASLVLANLDSTNFDGANLVGTNLSWSYMQNASFKGANLSYSDLSGAYMTDTKFIGANLTHATMEQLNSHNTNFYGANLAFAQLVNNYSPIENPNFIGANLTGANFNSTTIAGGSVIGANLTNASMGSAWFDPLPTGSFLGVPSGLPSNVSVENSQFLLNDLVVPDAETPDLWYSPDSTFEILYQTTDAFELPSVQWLRDGIAINGATSSTYTATSRDVGHYIVAQLTFQPSGYAKVVRTTTERFVHATTAINQNFVSSPTPVILGNVKVGSTATAFAGTWDADTTLSYQWLIDGSEVSGATGPNFVLDQTTYGHDLSVAVTGNKTDYASTTRTSSSYTVGAGTLLTTPVPALTGGSNVGDTLTMQVVNDDYLLAQSTQYKWYRCLTAVTRPSVLPTGCLQIKNASEASYTLQAPDAARYVTGSVTVTNSFGAITAYALQSSISNRAPEFSGLPSWSGTAKTGSRLVASTGTVIGYPDVSYSFQWYSCTDSVTGGVSDAPSGCTAIADETNSSYVVLDADAGKYVTVKVTAGNTVSSVSATAKSTAQVVQPISLETALTINGSFSVGSSLSVAPGSFVAYPTPTETYRWYRCTSPVLLATSLPSGCEVISRAAQRTYVPAANDVGKYLTVAVTAAARGSNSLTVWAGQNVATTASNVLAGASIALTPKVTSPKVSLRLVGDLKAGKTVSVLLSGAEKLRGAVITWKVHGKTIKVGSKTLLLKKQYFGHGLTVEYRVKTSNHKTLKLATRVNLKG
jgi:uncharacterized protein YjbI with pentapeptide repeats